MPDKRLTPARGDLAAKYLEGKVQADRFVAGEEFEVIAPIAPVREQPSSNAMLMTEVLRGERATIWPSMARRQPSRPGSPVRWTSGIGPSPRVTLSLRISAAVSAG